MRVRAWALGPVEETSLARQVRLDSFLTFYGPGGFATPDDIEALESVQQGVGAWREVGWSDYSRGYRTELEGPEDMIRSDHEIQIRAFYRRWHELVAAEGARP